MDVGRWLRGGVLVVFVGVMMTLAGCGGAGPVGRAPAPPSPDEADRLWQETLAAYRVAKTYRDLAVVRLTYKQDGTPVKSEAEASVRFARPNKLRMNAYQAQVSCDGHEFRARIQDVATNNLDGQFIARPAPDKLTSTELFGDELLHAQLGSGVIQTGLLREPLQVELLLAQQPFSGQASITERRIVGEGTMDGRTCRKLAATTIHGTFVFWIDPQQFVIRRVEYPREMLISELQTSPDIKDVALVADFVDARFNDEIGENLFTLDVPKDAKLVRFFVPPPQRLPSKLFGKPAGDFAFKRLGEGTVSQDDVRGKIGVLLWFNDYPACEKTLQSLQQLSADGQQAKDVVVLAICTEPSSFSDQQVRDLVKKWNVDLPVVRDLEAIGRDRFQIEGAPTLVVIDAEGTVQVVETGANPELGKELPVILEKLRKGESVAQQILEKHEQEQALYARQVAIASGSTPTTVVELPPTPIKPASLPKKLKLTPRWTNDQVASPGNLLVFGNDDASIAVAGGRSVTVLDRTGAVVTRHELALPEKASVSCLRTVVTAQGERLFVGSSPLGAQAFVFDEKGTVRLAYPPINQRHEGLRDVLLQQFDEGERELALYVGFWGTLGVQRVALNGERAWSNRAIPSVMSLAIAHANELGRRKLLVAGEPGRLMRLNQYGHNEPPFSIRERSVTQLYPSRFAPPQPTVYCGIGFNTDGNLLAVALDQELNEEWNYPLPPGLHRNAIEFVTSGSIRSRESCEWLFAAADGSIHIVSSDGEFLDYFHTGETLTGVTHSRSGDDSLIIVSTPQKIIAWQVLP